MFGGRADHLLEPGPFKAGNIPDTYHLNCLRTFRTTRPGSTIESSSRALVDLEAISALDCADQSVLRSAITVSRRGRRSMVQDSRPTSRMKLMVDML